jgi:hypothetical protein
MQEASIPMGICYHTLFMTALAAVLFIIMPSAAAINVAIYGDTAGFIPDLHRDTFTITFSLPGISGVDLDSNVSHYTNSSVDVIFMDGGEPFSPGTAAEIEDAVASGKILVIADTHYRNFAASMPVENTGTAVGSPSLQVSNPNTTFSQDIFAGLRTNYPNITPVTERSRFTTKPDAVTLISFSDGDPALAYSRYGNGYVIAWTPSSQQPYLTSTEADRINERLITHLLALRGPISVITLTTTNATPQATTIPPATLTMVIPSVTPGNITLTPNTTGTVPAPQVLGNVSVFSSPMGANVFIDGVYRGATPANLTGITPGYHALKLAMNGHYDHDSIIYVIEAGTITAFGTLPPRENNTVQVTPAPVPLTTANATVTQVPPSLLESPSVIAALLGVLTAVIGAAATIFAIFHKHKQP